MKIKPVLLYFYLAVALFTLVDMAVFLAMVWQGLKTSDSPMLMGFTICLATVVPYAVERMFEKHGSVSRSIKRLVLIRLAALLAILGLAYVGFASSPVGFVTLAFLIGMTDYFTISTLESKNIKLVLAGNIESEMSARFMQTAIQIGAFSGAFVGGIIVDAFSVSSGLLLIAGMGVMSLGLYPLIFEEEVNEVAKATPESGHPNANGTAAADTFPVMVKYLIFALAMIGFHIGAFNSLVPIVFQKLNGWNATLFGLASGLAGLGSFFAAFTPKITRSDYYYVIAICLADLAIVYSPFTGIMLAAAFVIGFCINQMRIDFRRQLVDLATNDRSADAIASKSSVCYLLMSGSAPLVLTFLTSNYMFGVTASKILMAVCGTLLAMAVVILAANLNDRSLISKAR